MRQFIQGVRNLIKWFPLVWADRDWDYAFTYRVLQFKMEQQANYLAKRNTFVNSQAYADHARTIAKLLEYNLDDYYGMEYMDHHELDFEFTPAEDNPNCSNLDLRVISEDFDSYFVKYPRVYKQILAGKINVGWEVDILDKSSIAFAISQYNSQRCKRILYAMLEKDLEKLWD